MRIIPLGDVQWETNIIAGQEKPYIQGWYSETYGMKVPNTCVTYASILEGQTRFGWLLVPAMDKVPAMKTQMEINNEMAFVSITKKDGTLVEVSVPLNQDLSKIRVEIE